MGSTKVLATKGSGKTPAVYAGVASAVAFMGPKRWWPPVFYFSSMMAADAEAQLRSHRAGSAPDPRRPQRAAARSCAEQSEEPRGAARTAGAAGGGGSAAEDGAGQRLPSRL